MNSVSKDIAYKLLSVAPTVVSGTFGGTANWSIFVNTQPTSPKNVFSVWDSPGRNPQYSMDKSKNPLRYSGFQLRVRGTNYNTTWSKLQDAIKALVQLGRFVVTDGTTDVIYSTISETTEIIPLGVDEKESYMFSSNLIAIRREKDA